MSAADHPTLSEVEERVGKACEGTSMKGYHGAAIIAPIPEGSVRAHLRPGTRPDLARMLMAAATSRCWWVPHWEVISTLLQGRVVEVTPSAVLEGIIPHALFSLTLTPSVGLSQRLRGIALLPTQP